MKTCGALIRTIAKLFVLFSVLFFSNVAVGQPRTDPQYNFVYRNWNSQNGLPQNTVYSMVQDHSGYLWGATEEGLFRFDGSQFTYINESNTSNLGANIFNDLQVNGDKLWASSRYSIVRIDKKVEQVIDFTKYVPGGWIKCIETDNRGRLWIATTTGKLYYMVDTVVHACPKWEVSNGLIETVTNTSRGIVIGTSRGIFTMHDPDQAPVVVPQFSGMNITAVTGGYGTELWVAVANKGFYHFDKDTILFSKNDGLRENFINSLYYSEDNKLWIGLRSNGYQIFENRKLVTPDQQAFAHDGIRCILISNDHVWMGSNSSGLLQLKPALIRTPPPAFDLSGKIILPIYQLPGGETWIGTAGAGVQRYQDGKLTSLKQENGLSNNVVLAIYGKDQYVFIGTSTGLDRFNRVTGNLDRTYGQQDGLKNNGVLCLFNDARNKLWIATRQGGLYTLGNSDSIQPFSLPVAFQQSALLTAFETTKHDIWFGSRGAGMFKVDSLQQINIFQEKQGFPAGIVYAFYEDAEGDIWIATERGLLTYYKSAFKTFNKENGLLFNEIYNILPDASGYLWLSGNLGLQRIEINELIAAKKSDSATQLAFRLFNSLDGMPNSETNGGVFPAGWSMQDGSLWFPTTKGVAVVDSRVVNEESNDLSIQLQALRYGDQEYFPGERIQLPPGIHNFEIHYTSIDFSKADDIQFYYRLRGLDDKWTAAKKRRIAFFSGLKPGNYVFEVRAERYGMSSPVVALPFRINPRFYQTIWFKILIGLMILGIIGGIIYSFRRAARRKLREQQHVTRALISGQEKERQFISTELHDSINQQLSIARMYLDMAKENEPLRLDMVTKSELVIREAIKEIVSLCNSLTPPSLKDIGLKDAIEELVDAYTSIGKFDARMNFQLNTSIIDEDLQFVLFRIAQESINNIARHSNAKNVALDFTQSSAGIHITIKDDGIGFDPKVQKQGMGLKNIRNRLSLYHGKMEIKAAKGKGCSMQFFIPKNGQA